MSMMLMVKAMQTKVGNPLRKLVLIKLADNANDLGECWPSHQHVSDQCEISKTSVRNHIRELERMGLLTVEHRDGPKGNTSNLYHLTLQGVPANDTGIAGAGIGGIAGDDTRISHSYEPLKESSYSSPEGDQKQQSKRAVFEMMAVRFMELIPEMPSVDLDANAKGRMTKAYNFYKSFKFDPARWDAYLMAIRECEWMLYDRVDHTGKVWKKRNFDFIITEKCYLGVKEDRYGSANANQNA